MDHPSRTGTERTLSRPKPYSVGFRRSGAYDRATYLKAMRLVFRWSDDYSNRVSGRLQEGEMASHPYPSREVAEAVYIEACKVFSAHGVPVSCVELFSE